MSSVPDPEGISRDATWLAQALDPIPGVARLIRMTPEDYREASFLDDRMLQRPVDAMIVPWTQIEAAMGATGREDARWIFHIGHVGSTLVARLLGELPTVLSVREPRLLRDLVAIGKRGAYVPTVRKLMSRSFGPKQIALVKATSFVSEVAPELIGQRGRALFLTASPRNYIASILAGENSVREVQMLSASRAQRMAARVGRLPQPRHLADLAAAAWACEMTALEAAAEVAPDGWIHWTDFDRLLGALGDELSKIADHLGLGAEPAQVQSLAGSPHLKRYSKAPEYDYSPDLRRELIAEATEAADGDIDQAVAMLAGAAATSPLLARALSRFEEQ